MNKLNLINLEGKISKINLNKGTNGQYGTITLAVDDGYFKKPDKNIQFQQNSKDEYVERSYFHLLSVNEKVLNSLFLAPMIGDEFIIYGKLVTKKWDNYEHPVTMIEVKQIVKHTPKTLIELGRSHGLIKLTKSNHQSGRFRQA